VIARVDWSRWAFAGGVAFVAACSGVAAGANPILCIRIALGIGFVVIAFTNLSLGLAFFIFTSFVSLYPYTRYDAAVRVILVIAWIAYVLTNRRAEFTSVHPIAALALLAFVGWSFISVGWAQDTGKALLSATQYALSALLLMITYTAIRNRKDLGTVLLAFLFGCVASIFYALAVPSSSGEGRLANSVLDPNLLGEALVCGLAIAAAILAMYRSPAIRLATLVSGALVLVGVLLTTSRSALIALGTAVLATIALAGRWRAIALLTAAIIVGATYIYFVQFAPYSAQQRVAAPLSGQSRIEDGRNTIWELALRAFKDKPITGVGAGNFRVVQVRYLLQPGVDRARTVTSQVIDDPAGKVAHNSFLSVMSELGIIGIVLFVFIIAFAIASLLKAARLFKRAGDGRMQVVAVALIVALVGSLTVQMFQSDQQGKVLWLLLGLGPAVLALAKNGEEEEAKSRPPRGQRPRPALPAYSSS
jgi:O-antigen ligase